MSRVGGSSAAAVVRSGTGARLPVRETEALEVAATRPPVLRLAFSGAERLVGGEGERENGRVERHSDEHVDVAHRIRQRGHAHRARAGAAAAVAVELDSSREARAVLLRLVRHPEVLPRAHSAHRTERLRDSCSALRIVCESRASSSVQYAQTTRVNR